MNQVIYWLDVEKKIFQDYFFYFDDTVYNSSISVCVKKILIIKLRCRFKLEYCLFAEKSDQ